MVHPVYIESINKAKTNENLHAILPEKTPWKYKTNIYRPFQAFILPSFLSSVTYANTEQNFLEQGEKKDKWYSKINPFNPEDFLRSTQSRKNSLITLSCFQLLQSYVFEV